MQRRQTLLRLPQTTDRAAQAGRKQGARLAKCLQELSNFRVQFPSHSASTIGILLPVYCADRILLELRKSAIGVTDDFGPQRATACRGEDAQ